MKTQRIINLTQHGATDKQVSMGVRDLHPTEVPKLKALLTFDERPSIPNDILSRVKDIVLLAREADAEAAMIGGALWLMAPLARELRTFEIEPLFAFSRRVTEEEKGPDGKVIRRTIFDMEGFVEAVE